MSLHSQSRKELENRRKKLNKEIEKINNLLFETKKEKTDALDDLKDLSQKITVRERLIETIELETEELSKEIKQNEKKIEQNNKELASLKADYAEMVFKSYKSKSQQSKTMFLLSSENFLQAYKRIKYIEQYKSFRKKQGERVIAKTEEIRKLNDSLTKKKNQKKVLINAEKNQKKKIESEKEEQETLVTKIKTQESKYKNELQKKIREEKALAKKIDKAIRDAIAKANKGKKGTAKKNEFLLSKAEKALKANFEQNKGNLPWPLDGVVTRKFGVQPHPTFKSITINSTGLHIRGKQGDVAKSVFNGKVLNITKSDKGTKSVMVQHGDYITTYSNLRDIFVTKGQSVKTGDAVGKIFTDKITGKTDLVFVLFKNTDRLNPSDWIRAN
ncbi:septal ring factor EnvC (AmiA/AmiB activator) [Tenacibaculum skagerrakense]|uniref:Septal ring factor EnvC (AmiA/AmiB activator) n=1 Tax=Tenacibaculum skagerrakense TaxID=186571 RepID=A0A4R2P2E1_9FLAO|nr:peptidoglycan DD-metalloendopeptidase family protein [Tenacibaculum skagerrakense]TCP27865.1 septal ring factor EnvC (AmiA/AmiB activator) [Tenacibaculum skagerrakense]